MEKPTSSKHSDIKSQSVAYWYFRDFWEDCLNLYEPLPDTLHRYLKKYEKEDATEYANRVRSLAQINMVYLIIEATISYLMSTNIEVTAKKHEDAVKKFVECCNPQGDRLVDMLREEIAPTSLNYGFADIVVDMPEQKDDVLSVEQAKARGLVPYCYLIPPLNRYNWSVDGNGNFSSYYSADILNTQIQGNLNLSQDPEERKEYQVWTLDMVTRYDSKGDVISEKKNPYGYIPIVTCAPVSKSLRYPNERLGRSLVQDVLPLQKLILNVMSLIFDFHENANFPYRVYKHDDSAGDGPPTEGELAEGGNKRGILMNGGPNSNYFLVEPNPAGVNAMVSYLECLIERCYQQVMMPSDANTNKTHQSGTTIRSNQAALFNKLTTYTRRFERTVKEIVEMSLRVQGLNPYEAEVSVKWDTNFSYESFTNAQEQLSLVIQNLRDMSPTAVSEFAKKVMSPQLFGSGMMDTVTKELEKWAKQPPIQANDPANPQDAPKTLQQNSTQIAAADKISNEGEGNF